MKTGNPVPRLALLAALPWLFSLPAQGQVVYCKEIGHNKTYCSGGTILHQFEGTTVMTNAVPAPPPPTLPNPLQQDNALPTPRPAGGATPGMPPVTAPAAAPAVPGAAPTVIVAPPGSRLCHLFGTTLVCN